MKSIVVLCWLAVVALAIGCATGKNELVTPEKTVDAQYAVRQITLPEQKTGPMPFTVRAISDWRVEKDFVSAMIVSEYLEAIAASGRLPLRVREGFFLKERGGWRLIEVPADTVTRVGCVGPRIFCAIPKDVP